VEVIDGRPVFYGLGNFIWSDVQDPLPGYYFDEARELIDRRFAGGVSALSDADLIEALNEGVFDEPDVYRAVIAELSIDGDTTGIRLVPVELGFGRPLTDRGIPAVVEGEVADAILERMRSISSALGAHVGANGTVEG
jgi:poly-gamma-glutamate synthesis protein (capsule biosynthesis protein)